MPVFKSVNRDFFKKWSSEMAYVLGFFAADGYITVNRRGGQFLGIQITDKNLLISIKKEMGSEHKIGKRDRGGNKQPTYRLQVGSIEMCDDLRGLGFCEKKVKRLKMPNIPKKYFSDFVRGYFDGDGNVWVGFVNKKRTNPVLTIVTMFTSCSTEFLHSLWRKLREEGLSGGSIYNAKGNYSRLQFGARDSLKLQEFMYNQNCLKKRLFLERKKKVFKRYNTLKKTRAVVV